MKIKTLILKGDFQKVLNELTEVIPMLSDEQLQEMADMILPKVEGEPNRGIPAPKRDFLTIDQMATMLNVSRSTLWRYEKSGKLKPVLIGNKKVYARSAIDNIVSPQI